LSHLTSLHFVFVVSLDWRHPRLLPRPQHHARPLSARVPRHVRDLREGPQDDGWRPQQRPRL